VAARAGTDDRAGVHQPGVGFFLRFPSSGPRRYTYTGFRIGAYPTARDAFSRALGGGDASIGVRLGAGMATGFVGAAVFNPLDVLRVRLQLDPRRYPTYDVFAGLRALAAAGAGEGWRGWPVNVGRAALLSGSQLATYDTSKREAKRRLGVREGPALHVARPPAPRPRAVADARARARRRRARSSAAASPSSSSSPSTRSRPWS